MEVKRIEGFDSGDITCDCGRTFKLHWNGGELDQHKCECGLIYQTEWAQIDLVISKEE